MYKIEFSPKSIKQLKKLDKIIQIRIINHLKKISKNPKKYIEKLIDKNGYKTRIGKYRLFLDINKKRLIILVIKIGHRKNVYKKG